LSDIYLAEPRVVPDIRPFFLYPAGYPAKKTV